MAGRDDFSEWLDKGTPSSLRVPLLFPILVRQARLGTPITYGAAAHEIGLHHRAIHHIAGLIGYTLKAVGKTPDWRKRPPPPLQALVVNDGTGIPGGGVNGFMSSTYNKAGSDEKRRTVLKAVYAELKAYKHWDELSRVLELPITTSVGNAVELARKSRGRGGEGPEHMALKSYVATNPSLVGLTTHKPGKTEFPLASGDRVDVVFESTRTKTAVEVKSAVSDDGDIARGLFQCLKYRVVLEKEAELSKVPFDVAVFLVLGKPFPAKLIPLRNSLDVVVIDNVMP